MQLHDCMSRLRMFRDFDPNDEHLATLEAQAGDLRKLLKLTPYFLALPVPLQAKLLKGQQANILTQDEILQRMGTEPSLWRGLYRFFSSHTHSFPLAYYRMAEHGRGHGLENYVDKGYIGGAVDQCAGILRQSTDDMRRLFEGMATFPDASFNWNALKRSRALRRHPNNKVKRKS
jgi:hypothetical protein